MDEQVLEQELQDKGLDAPRLTPEDIDAVIVDETYTMLPGGKRMVCELTLENGFTVRGESACVSKENFDEDIGKRVSREDARNKVWGFEAYLLQESIKRNSLLPYHTVDGGSIDCSAISGGQDFIGGMPGKLTLTKTITAGDMVGSKSRDYVQVSSVTSNAEELLNKQIHDDPVKAWDTLRNLAVLCQKNDVGFTQSFHIANEYMKECYGLDLSTDDKYPVV